METMQLNPIDHPQQTAIDKMTEVIRDIYALQHFVMTHPDLPVTYWTSHQAWVQIPYVGDRTYTDEDQVDVAKVAEYVRAMKDGGKVTKRSNEYEMTYTRTLGKNAKIILSVPRDSVCVKRVVGTEKVIHEAKAGYTETREIVEWDCVPILAKEDD